MSGLSAFSTRSLTGNSLPLMELQGEYMKKAHETFVAESKRISELYAGFFKQMTKPLEDLIEKNKAA